MPSDAPAPRSRARAPVLITWAQAQEILEVSGTTLAKLIRAGLLDSRGRVGPGRGSLDRTQVRALARRRARERERTKQRREQLAAAKPDRRPKPPDTEHDWLSTAQVADLLGVTPSAVKQRCRRGGIPHTWHDGRRWLRRDLVQTWLRAREAQRSRLT